MKTRLKAISVLILCICVFFTGCIGNGGKDGKDEYGIADPETKGTLNLSSYTPDTLNPLTTEYSCVRDFLHLAYEGLFVVNEDLSVTGVLATEYTASQNNTRFSIKLKKGVKFHDGSKFTARDVVATFEYIRMFSDYYRDVLAGVTHFEAEDDYTVVITLASPKANFVANLDFPILPAGLKEHQLKGDKFEMNGTGRYKHKKTNPYVSLIMEKNPSWHKKDNVFIPEVCVRFLNDNDAIVHAFDSGETDIITTDRARWGEFPYSGGFKTYEVTTTKYLFVGMNTRNGLFTDINARKAIASLINKEAVVDTVMFSHGTAADSPITSKAHFYRNDSPVDLEAAPDIFKDKGVEKLFILFNTEDSTKKSVAVYIKRQLEDLGIKAELSEVDYDTYISKIAQNDYQLYIGKVDIKRDCDIGFMFDKIVEKQVIQPREESTEEASAEPETVNVVEKSSGICNFADEKLFDIISNMNTAKGVEALKLACNNLTGFYGANIPQIPLAHINDAMLVNGRIKGAPKPNLTNFYADIGGIYIE